jgi:uncharacterized FlgJ-related protein
MKNLILLFLFIPWICSSKQITQRQVSTDSVSVDELIKTVWALPFKHKDIVVAQAILETGWFKSYNYITNNNLFGMKHIYTRVTTSDTTINGYSHYPNWRMSVIDYYLMQSTRESIIPTSREQYYRYLDMVYSEVGSSYSNQLKDIISRLDMPEVEPVHKQHSKKHHKRSK